MNQGQKDSHIDKITSLQYIVYNYMQYINRGGTHIGNVEVPLIDYPHLKI